MSFVCNFVMVLWKYIYIGANPESERHLNSNPFPLIVAGAWKFKKTNIRTLIYQQIHRYTKQNRWSTKLNHWFTKQIHRFILQNQRTIVQNHWFTAQINDFSWKQAKTLERSQIFWQKPKFCLRGPKKTPKNPKFQKSL